MCASTQAIIRTSVASAWRRSLIQEIYEGTNVFTQEIVRTNVTSAWRRSLIQDHYEDTNAFTQYNYCMKTFSVRTSKDIRADSLIVRVGELLWSCQMECQHIQLLAFFIVLLLLKWSRLSNKIFRKRFEFYHNSALRLRIRKTAFTERFESTRSRN